MSTYVYVDEAAGGFQAPGQGAARKPVQRRTVDYTATTVRHLEMRVYQKDPWDNAMLQPTNGAMLDVSAYLRALGGYLLEGRSYLRSAHCVCSRRDGYAFPDGGSACVPKFC